MLSALILILICGGLCPSTGVSATDAAIPPNDLGGPQVKNTMTFPPHIVFIVLDDFGYNDLGTKNNKEIYSPNMDALLADGIELENYYVECVCSPSRATFLTGRKPLHTGVVDYIPQAAATGLLLNELTIADRLTSIGYISHAIGTLSFPPSLILVSTTHCSLLLFFSLLLLLLLLLELNIQ